MFGRRSASDWLRLSARPSALALSVVESIGREGAVLQLESRASKPRITLEALLWGVVVPHRQQIATHLVVPGASRAVPVAPIWSKYSDDCRVVHVIRPRPG